MRQRRCMDRMCCPTEGSSGPICLPGPLLPAQISLHAGDIKTNTQVQGGEEEKGLLPSSSTELCVGHFRIGGDQSKHSRLSMVQSREEPGSHTSLLQPAASSKGIPAPSSRQQPWHCSSCPTAVDVQRSYTPMADPGAVLQAGQSYMTHCSIKPRFCFFLCNAETSATYPQQA